MAPRPSFDDLKKAKQARMRAAGAGSEGVHGRAPQPTHGVGGGVISRKPAKAAAKADPLAAFLKKQKSNSKGGY